MGTIDFTDNIYDAQQGSQSAIKFIYDNTIQLFYKESMVFLRDKADIDAAIRDTYIFIFDHLNTLEDASKFLLWANEVCKNTCIARLKQYGAFDERIPAEAANLGEILPSSDYDQYINTNASMSIDHVRICLEAVLNSLPDNQRACAVLWGEGYPLKSISRKLDMSTIAVNYTLACTLGNITNAVITLGDNGLPLFSMEPIPFFLWLLINFYENYQPEDLAPGAESTFSNILRILMPEEASIFMSDFIYSEAETDSSNGKVKHITGIESEQFKAEAPGYSEQMYSDDNITHVDEDAANQPDESDSNDEFDAEAESNAGSAAEDNESIFGSSSDTAVPAPDMDIYDARKGQLAGADEPDSSEDTEDETPDAEADETATDETDEISTDETESDAADAGAGIIIGTPADVSDGNASSDNLSDEDKAAIDSIIASADEVTADGAAHKKKKNTALIIVLIVVIVILLALLAMFIFRDQVNKVLGDNWFGSSLFATATEEETTTEAVTEPETTTEAPTTTIETTVEETTTEEPTTEEVFTGTTYNVLIYADGESLSMYSQPTNESVRITYVPSDYEVTVTETQGGWGHINYEGSDGWIWLEFTKVATNGPIQTPEEMLAQTEERTVIDSIYMDLRLGATVASSSFGTVPAGTVLTIEAYDASYTWAYTSYNGHHGWISVESLG